MFNRFVVFRLLILLLFVVMTGRLWSLQVSQTDALSEAAQGHTEQTVWERPLRGEILASDGKTRLAESLPAYTMAIRSNQLPSPVTQRVERQQVFARLTDMLNLQANVVLSPTDELRYVPGLRTGLETLVGPLPGTVLLKPTVVLTAPVGQALEAFALTERFSTTLKFMTPVEQRLLIVGGPPYQTIGITTTRSLDLALMVQENTAWLPGVVVERDYERFYPRSGQVQSLSHLLGYVRKVDMCDIMEHNPPHAYGEYSVAAQESCGIEPGHLLVDSAPMRYLLNDRIGKDGLEAAFERELRGYLGEQAVEIDVHSRLVSEPKVIKPTVDGNNVVLTIDFDLQLETEKIVRKWIYESERRRQNPPNDPRFAGHRQYTPIEAGVALVLEVNTGRVLAMVSWPSFDNNVFNRPLTDQEAAAIFDPNKGEPYSRHPTPALNQAIAGLYPPGSAWKLFTASAALAGGTITANTLVRDPGVLYVKNQYHENNPAFDQVFPNSIRRDNAWIDVRKALEVSSNVFFQSVMGGTRDTRNIKESEQIDGLDGSGEALARMALAYGFGEPSGIDLPNENWRKVPSKAWKANLEYAARANEPWSVGEMYNTAIGQGDVLVTPLQLTVASAAVANGGTLYRPQLVKEIRDAQGQVVRQYEPEVRRQVPVSADMLQVIREGMRRSVTVGANQCARADISGLEIAGKTGTAEYIEQIDPTKPMDQNEVSEKGNWRKRSHSWFVGFAPYDNPQIEVLAFVAGSGDLGDGSATITVPAVAEIMQAYFGVTPPTPPATFKPLYPCH